MLSEPLADGKPSLVAFNITMQSKAGYPPLFLSTTQSMAERQRKA